MWLYDHNTWNFDSLTEDHYDTHNLEKEFFKKKKKKNVRNTLRNYICGTKMEILVYRTNLFIIIIIIVLLIISSQYFIKHVHN